MFYIKVKDEMQLLKCKLCQGNVIEFIQNRIIIHLPLDVNLVLVDSNTHEESMISSNDVYENYLKSKIINILSYKYKLIICLLDCYNPFLDLAFREHSVVPNKVADMQGAYFLSYLYHTNIAYTLFYGHKELSSRCEHSKTLKIVALSSDGKKLVTLGEISEVLISSDNTKLYNLTGVLSLYNRGKVVDVKEVDLGVSKHNEIENEYFDKLNKAVIELLAIE